MPGAVIVADQPSGAGAGTPGVSRNDLWQNQVVNLSVGTSGNSSYQWVLLDKPPGSAASITGSITSNASFLPDLSGAYRIRLTTNGGGAGNVQTLVLRVRKDSSGVLANRGYCLPAFGEVAGEDNAGGNLRGWAPQIEFIIADVIANAFTGGGGGGITSIAGLTASAITISNGGGVNVVPNTSNLAFSIGFVGTNALGDIPVRGGSNYARLPIGSTGQVLTVVGGTAAWATPATSVTSIAGSSGVLTFGTAGNVVGAAAGSVLNFNISVSGQTQGDILYYNGTGWVRLPAGTSGQFLQTQGGGLNPLWASSPSAPVLSVAGRTGAVTVTQGAGVLVTTPSGTDITIKKGYAVQAQGDVDYFDGTNWVRLPAGTAGQALTTGGTGANPAWATIVTSLNAQTGAVSLAGSNGVVVGTPSAGTIPITMGFSGQAQGDVAYFDGTNWTRLPAGTSGQFLKTNGTLANPAWAAVTTLPNGVDGEIWAANNGTQAFTPSPRIGSGFVMLSPSAIFQNASSQVYTSLISGVFTLGHSTATSGGVYMVGGASAQFRFVHGSAISMNITRSSNAVAMGTDALATAFSITHGTSSLSSGTAGNFTIAGQDASNAAVNMGNLILKVPRNTADATKIGKLQITTGAATWGEISNDGVSWAPGGANVAFRFGSLTAAIGTGHNVVVIANGTAPGALVNCAGMWVESGVLKGVGVSGVPTTIAA